MDALSGETTLGEIRHPGRDRWIELGKDAATGSESLRRLGEQPAYERSATLVRVERSPRLRGNLGGEAGARWHVRKVGADQVELPAELIHQVAGLDVHPRRQLMARHVSRSHLERART